MKTSLSPAAAAVLLALSAGPASAEVYDLCAEATTKTMPDGSSVPVWGYVLDTDSATAGCQGVVEIPGPRLEVTDGTLTINLTNNLPEPTSIVIPGLPMPTPLGPTWSDGTTGARNPAADPPQRVRSFGVETAAGDTVAYSFTVNRPGTFIYHSGTHPQKQVYMGLYGPATQDAATGEVYPGVAYDNEVVLFYSDIDPVFNAAVAADTLTTAMGRHPSWFLVNGEPYVDGMEDTAIGSAGQRTLLRLLSAATETHVPVLQGLYMTIHAEDGLQYAWEDTATGETGFAPREQYSAMLPPLKTKDAIVIAAAEGRYAVYDGNGYMTNPSDPNEYSVGDTVGGMLRFLSFGPANQVPVAVDDTATTPEDTPIDINVLANDSDPDGDPLTIIAVTDGSIGTVTISNPSCCVTYTPNPDATGPDQFTYTITDGNGVTSTATASVDVTVTAVNDAPVAQDDGPYTTDEDVALNVAAPGVLGNDSDVDGDALTAVLQTAPSSGVLTLNPDGSFSYTPNADFNGGDSFTYVANDGALDSNPATVSITVNPVNDAPVITSTPVEEAPVNAEYQYQVTATDADGDAITLALDAGPAGMAMDGAGLVTWTPALFDLGDHTVTVSASDGSLSGTQSYTLTVVPAGAGTDGPVFFSNVSNLVGPPGVAGPYNNANIYAYDGDVYSAIVYFIDTMGFQANIDGLQMVDGDTFYVSFSNDELTTVPGIAAVQDEDVLLYNAGTWSVYFDGTLYGLTTADHDIDAISVVGGMLYFSTLGNANVGGLGAADDADIYGWNGSAFSRVLDASGVGLPNVADVDGLTVKGTTFYMSFNRNAGTNVPGVGTVQDEAVVSYNGSTWSMYFSGPGLDGDDGQDIDAVHVP